MTAVPRRTVETGTETVDAHVVDGVGVVTLNRPHRRNALHGEMYDGVPRALDAFAADDGVGCVLITGAGTSFCAGGDVRDGGSRSGRVVETEDHIQENARRLTRNARMVTQLHDMPKVTIAALPGPAAGAGIGIALSTDFRIAARSAKLIPGWGKLAFSGDFGGTWFLTRLVGPSRALELLVEGTAIDSDAALRLGLFNKVVDDDQLSSAALAWAAKIAAGPSSTWASMKANVLDAQEHSLADVLPRESERMVRCGTTEDHRRAVKDWLSAAAEKAKARAVK